MRYLALGDGSGRPIQNLAPPEMFVAVQRQLRSRCVLNRSINNRPAAPPVAGQYAIAAKFIRGLHKGVQLLPDELTNIILLEVPPRKADHAVLRSDKI